MKEIKFEEKGTWVELKINELEQIWHTNKFDHRQWPERISQECSDTLKDLSKLVNDKKRKLELFFQAKGIVEKTSFYKIFFREIEFVFSEQASKYIDRTIGEAEEFYGISFDEFREKIY